MFSNLIRNPSCVGILIGLRQETFKLKYTKKQSHKILTNCISPIFFFLNKIFVIKTSISFDLFCPYILTHVKTTGGKICFSSNEAFKISIDLSTIQKNHKTWILRYNNTISKNRKLCNINRSPKCFNVYWDCNICEKCRKQVA